MMWIVMLMHVWMRARVLGLALRVACRRSKALTSSGFGLGLNGVTTITARTAAGTGSVSIADPFGGAVMLSGTVQGATSHAAWASGPALWPPCAGATHNPSAP